MVKRTNDCNKKWSEVRNYIRQWFEVKEMTEGKTMDDIRLMFQKNITNDLSESDEEGLRHDLIDINYKDILVTFIEKKDKAVLHDFIEMYNKEGIFIGAINVKDYIYTGSLA